MGRDEVKKEVKEKNGNSKKVAIIVAIVVIILSILIGAAIYVGYNAKQIALLTGEASKLASIQTTTTSGQINKDAAVDMEIKTKGDYAVVEQTMKDYLKEFVDLLQDIENVYNSEELQSTLTADNIQKDGPDFIQTKKMLEEYKQKSDEYIDKLLLLADEENMLSAIDDKDVSDYYKEMYKKLMIDENTSKSLTEGKEDLQTARQTINKVLDGLLEAVNYLSGNQSEWQLSNGQILFKSQTKLNEYNKIINTLR